MFLSKPKILIENCDGHVVPWFSGPEEIIPVAMWYTPSPLSSENSADNKIELIELLRATVTFMMTQHFIE